MIKAKLEKIEVNILLEAIYQQYGYDFRNYSRAAINLKIKAFMQELEIKKISELIPYLLYDKYSFYKLFDIFSNKLNNMFRDPFFYETLREYLKLHLENLRFIKIWVAGCSTGEELYSLAILLKETDLYDKTIIFATDKNERMLRLAKQGCYSEKSLNVYSTNYEKAGGIKDFSQYYTKKNDTITINDFLKEKITFACHDLATNKEFGKMDLIFCRNKLIYFNKKLQNKVVTLLSKSTKKNALLCLGRKDMLEFSESKNNFELVANEENIFKRL